ncbi:ankyrin repeat domain-containing protein 49-like [Haliotis rufescens]|uniref:ankyrin repeat domain-containing protein 49-like n=1 Tax=Haliotis rufescens TaxID=6454 RepID=UPI00201F1024|nr:ankyrin repeat domain-containing protein 49-like [Haliotis rufescens]
MLTPRCSATKKDSDLSKASREGKLRAVAGILAAGLADVNCRAGNGKTPVILAAYGGHREVVELLMSKGANVSLVDSVGNNLLHNACLGGDMKTVEFVLALNVVDIDARNGLWQRAVDLARFWRYPLVVDLLISRGA